MKAPHLLRVEAGPEPFAPLLAAAAAAGVRVGWLELQGNAVAADAPTPPLLPMPPSLDAAAAWGALRAVAVAPGRSVAVKPLRGAAVLRDLLREHFRGCALVLVANVAGPAAVEPALATAPLLRPLRGAIGVGSEGGEAGPSREGGEGATAWEVVPPGTAPLRLGTAELLAALRRPRPW